MAKSNGEAAPKKQKTKKEEKVISESEEKIALFLLSILLVIALFVFFKFATLPVSPTENATSALATDAADLDQTQAALYCSQQGYTVEKRDGIQLCVFPDASSCEESSFFNGVCANPRNDCTLTLAALNATKIAPEELERGWYLGSCDQKKKDTPGNWLHMMEELGGMWYRPTNDTGSRCDCFVYYLPK
jgi:putative hemolysin